LEEVPYQKKKKKYVECEQTKKRTAGKSEGEPIPMTG